MIRNAYPYYFLLRQLGDLNIALIEMFRQVGMPTQIDHAVMNLSGDFNRYVEITYILLEGEPYMDGVIWDYFLRFDMQGEVVAASEGKTTFTNGLDVSGDQTDLAGAYEVYLRALVKKRHGLRKAKSHPEELAAFIRETEDIFDYPEGYVKLFDL